MSKIKFDCLTLFPEMFNALKESIIGRAIENENIELNLINIRDFSKDKHKKLMILHMVEEQEWL